MPEYKCLICPRRDKAMRTFRSAGALEGHMSSKHSQMALKQGLASKETDFDFNKADKLDSKKKRLLSKTVKEIKKNKLKMGQF